jgi:diaminopimelate epimerase
MATLNTLKFTKMHGAGNDFVVLDNCAGQLDLSPGLVKKFSSVAMAHAVLHNMYSTKG